MSGHALQERAPAQKSTIADYRLDIEGLRAVAILLVVAYHAGLPLIGGGFIGVDVFFVISGYLITSILLREALARGSISIPQFYARRMRRLLPAIALMVVVVAALSYVALSPLRRSELGADVIASGLFVANWYFAAQAVDYLGAQSDPSPMLHMWSLAVEEQFYLVWPLLMIGSCALARRRGWSLRRTLGAVVAVLGLVSLVFGIVQTSVAPGIAFFSSLTRAWELAVGAAVAIGSRALARTARMPALIGGWLGLLALVGAALAFDTGTSFPGAAALLPVLGTGAIIAAGATGRGGGVGRVLALPLLTAIGRVSYGWYLWHWPLLIIAAQWAGHDLSLPAALAVVAVAFLLAQFSYRFVESPIRRAPALRGRAMPALALGIACTLVVVATGVLLRSSRAVEAAVADAPGAAALVTTPGRPAPQRTIQASADAVRPTPKQARTDLPVLYSNGCHRSFTDISVEGCVFGATTSAKTVVLFGDSHAAMWFPALLALANAHDWRLVALTKSGCPAATMQPYNSVLKRGFVECTQWRTAALGRIRAEKPALVFTTSINGYSLDVGGAPVTGAPALKAQTDGWVQTLRQLTRYGPVAFLRDTPDMGTDVASCVSAHLDDLRRCAVARASALPTGQSDELAQGRLANLAGLHPIDVNDDVCVRSLCPAVIGSVIVYRDKDHLTATFSATMSAVLAPLLLPLVR